MWELTSDERRQLAKGDQHLDQNLQTKKQLFSIYKEESRLRKRFEEVLNSYDEDDVEGNAYGVTQRMEQALAERRRYFSVNAISSSPEKKLSLPNVLTSPKTFQKPVFKPIETPVSEHEGERFGSFPALLRQQIDTIKSGSCQVRTNVEVKKKEALVNSEKAQSNIPLTSLDSSRSFVIKKRGLLRGNSFDALEYPRMTIQQSGRKRSLSFPSSSSVIRGSVVRGTRGRKIGFASRWKTRLHRRPYLVIP